MAQAKTLTQAEVDQVLRYVAGTRYRHRNRALVLTSVWSGMRVGEIAALRVCDVVNDDGTIKREVRLSAQQTKGNYGRVVFVNEKLREIIMLNTLNYLNSSNNFNKAWKTISRSLSVLR